MVTPKFKDEIRESHRSRMLTNKILDLSIRNSDDGFLSERNKDKPISINNSGMMSPILKINPNLINRNLSKRVSLNLKSSHDQMRTVKNSQVFIHASLKSSERES